MLGLNFKLEDLDICDNSLGYFVRSDWGTTDTGNAFFTEEVISPTGNKFTLERIQEVLSEKLEFGNQEQIEALRAFRYFNALNWHEQLKEPGDNEYNHYRRF